MPLSGPVGCHRDGITPFFIVVESPTYGSIAVAVTLSALLYASAASKLLPWPRVLALFVPAAGLALGHTFYDRLISVPAATLLVWLASGQTTRQLGVTLLTVVVGFILALAGHECDSLGFVLSDIVAVVAAVASLISGPRQVTTAQLWAAAEFAIVVIILASDPTEIKLRETHLTWQNIVAQAVWLFSYIRKVDSYVWLTCILLNVVVLIGVWFMSAAKCDLLQNSLDDVGGLTYLIGNFILHYYPSLRLISTPPTHLVRPARQVVVAIAVVALYCATNDPKVVYGCAVWLARESVCLGFTALILIATVALSWSDTLLLGPR